MSRTITNKFHGSKCAECHYPIAAGETATFKADAPMGAKIVCKFCQPPAEPIKKESK